ncbi:hypothetical protein HY504_00975 [Candidatus Wolfebacteria bacterium]|nr:hypothetical protein [Candidatus Wolfebacteria bacterium]
MEKIRHVIYPPTAHFITRHLSLAGFVSLVVVLLGGVYVGIRSFPQADKYLALTITNVQKATNKFIGATENLTGAASRPGRESDLPAVTDNASPTDLPAPNAPEALPAVNGTSTFLITPPDAVASGRPPAEPRPGQTRTRVYAATSTAGPTILPNGAPDLEIKIIETGIISNTGVFMRATSTGRGEQTGVVFEVANIGTAVAGPWRFAAELPTTPGDFTSEIQEPLAPGEKIRYTIGFRLLRNQGPNTVRIITDPSRAVRDETNLGNNSATVTVIRNYP